MNLNSKKYFLILYGMPTCDHVVVCPCQNYIQYQGDTMRDSTTPWMEGRVYMCVYTGRFDLLGQARMAKTKRKDLYLSAKCCKELMEGLRQGCRLFVSSHAYYSIFTRGRQRGPRLET